jgi:hypothetical protein
MKHICPNLENLFQRLEGMTWAEFESVVRVPKVGIMVKLADFA